MVKGGFSVKKRFFSTLFSVVIFMLISVSCPVALGDPAGIPSINTYYDLGEYSEFDEECSPLSVEEWRYLGILHIPNAEPWFMVPPEYRRTGRGGGRVGGHPEGTMSREKKREYRRDESGGQNSTCRNVRRTLTGRSK
jgi:hypothetical protein